MHSDLSKHHWRTFNKKCDGYVERDMEDRKRFWDEWLRSIEDRFWKCSLLDCHCEGFELDNLKFLEELSLRGK